jgi:hypothetical protein
VNIKEIPKLIGDYKNNPKLISDNKKKSKTGRYVLPPF